MGDEIYANSDNPYSITEDILQARSEQTKVGRVSTQMYAGILACLSAASFGMILGWSNPLRHKSHKEKHELNEHILWITSMVPLGSSIGVLAKSYTAEKFGPRKTLLAEFPFYILTWILIALVPQLDLYKAFFLGYLGISHIVCGKNLLQDTVHQHLLKYLIVAYNFSLLLGVWIMHLLGFIFSNKDLTLTCVIIPVIHSGLLLFAPESPVFLFQRSEKAAEKSMAWYKGSQNILLDMKFIKKDCEARRIDPATYSYIFCSKVVMKALLIVLGVIFFQVFCGYIIFLFYDTCVWNDNKEIYSYLNDTAITGFFLIFSNLLWSIIHTRNLCNVRKSLIISCFLVALQLTGLSVYLGLDYYKIKMPQFSELIPISFAGMLIFFYEMGLNYYPNILLSEYIPRQVYKRANMISQFTLWFLIFIMIKTIPYLQTFIPSFIIFSGLTLFTYFGSWFCYMFVVEPRGKSFVQLQIEIGGNPVGTRGIVN